MSVRSSRSGENRREALKIAAGLRGEDAFAAGVAEEQALESVLPWLSRERATELLAECLELYVWDRLGVRELARSSSATAWAVSRKWMPCMPASRAAVTLTSTSSRNAHSSPGRPRRSSVSA